MRKLAVVLLVACSSSPKPFPDMPPPRPEPQPLPSDPIKQPPLPTAPPAHPVATDTYHGIVVEDRYRWLEDNTDEVKAWADAIDKKTRAQLDAIPDKAQLQTELTAIMNAKITEYWGFQASGGKLFGMRRPPGKEQPELIVLDDPTKPDKAKVILDPTAGGKATTALDWFVPSPDGKRIAVSISEGGSESGTLHVVGLDGKDLEAPIPNVQHGTAGGDVAWTSDGKGIYYTKYTDGNFYVQVWFHALGTPQDKDHYEIGKDQPKIGEFMIDTDKRGRVLVRIQDGDGGMFRHLLRNEKGEWKQFADWPDRIIYSDFGSSGDIWLVSLKDAPHGKLMKLSKDANLATSTVVIPEGKDTIQTGFLSDLHGVVDTGDRLYLNYQTGGPEELRVFTRDGKPGKAIALPPVSSVGWPVPWKKDVLVDSTSYTKPRAYYLASEKGVNVVPALSDAPPVDLSKMKVERVFATSKDGTKVPLNIVMPADAKKDGSTPCIINGYGGYGISLSPGFLSEFAPLLNRGFCFVQANIRGGGEYGDAWHRAGNLLNKQNVFDDFAAVIKYVEDNKYSSRDHVGLIGGSNGGLLMGAILTQHPDIMKAVVSAVGVYDMLRVELTSNGEFNVTEYGTVKDPAQFKALYAYSPYHHVTKQAYPATFMLTGDNDPRVEPWHSRKMLAAMQDNQTGQAPLLLRVSHEAGHGIGTNKTEEIEQAAAISAFFLWQLR
ncbi:MAG TPA: alpha/beta fold hydrolase [Kofleriaceae bacterium]|nr:alpha/beta fold hydrolase [Kofleriaceae bacterium]